MRKNFLKHRQYILLLVIAGSFIVLFFSLFLTYKIRPYNSDDVGIQNAILSWRPFSHQTLYLSPDTWLANIPFYLFFSLFMNPGRHLLFVEGLFFAFLNLVFFYISLAYFYKKFKIKFNSFSILPVIWLTSFGSSLMILFLNTNLRNYEIGLSFVLFMIVSIVLDGVLDFRKNINKFAYVLVCAIIGLLVLNDPMYLYLVVFPIIFFLLFHYLKSSKYRKRIRTIFYGFILSGVFYEIFRKLLILSGVKIYPQPPTFVNYATLFSNISTAFHGLLIVFSADIFGRNLLNLTTIGYSINFLLLLFIIYRMFKAHNQLSENGKNDPSYLAKSWLTFFIFEFWFIFVVYFISNQLFNLLSYRYLVLEPFLISFMFIPLINNLDKNIKLFLLSIISVSVLFNVIISFVNTNAQGIVPVGNLGNSQDYTLIQFLESKKLFKGYGQYWEANIETYLSNNKIDIYPVVCSNNKTVLFNWFVNGGQLNKLSKNSFIILDYSGTPMCSSTDILNEFGKPYQEYLIQNKEILIYNYDIGLRIKQFPSQPAL